VNIVGRVFARGVVLPFDWVYCIAASDAGGHAKRDKKRDKKEPKPVTISRSARVKFMA
jgi:hypothetical protein